MICPKCGAENDDINQHCVKCGHSLNEFILCPNCNMKNDKTNKYCLNCGHSLIPEFKEKNKLATFLGSLLVPGIGYFYLGYRMWGILIFCLFMTLSDISQRFHGSCLILIYFALKIIQAIDAIRRVNQYNKRKLTFNNKNNLHVAMLLSIIFAGLGLFCSIFYNLMGFHLSTLDESWLFCLCFGIAYIGLYKRFAIESITLYFLSDLNIYLAFIFYIYVLYDTYVCFKAKEKNEKIPRLFGLLDIK